VCEFPAPAPPGAVVLTTPLLAQRDRRRPLRSKLGFVRQTLGVRGNPSFGDECGDDDGAETRGNDDMACVGATNAVLLLRFPMIYRLFQLT